MPKQSPLRATRIAERLSALEVGQGALFRDEEYNHKNLRACTTCYGKAHDKRFSVRQQKNPTRVRVERIA